MARKIPALKLTKSPLVLVLAQIRFPAVLKMFTYVPEVQESLRQAGFSRYAEEQIQEIVFGPEIKTEKGSRWLFATRDKRQAVVLTNDFVVYETTQYDVFETFLDRVRAMVDVIKAKVQVDLSEQIGLRYVDLIRQINGRAPRDLLKEPLRGLTNDDLDASESRQQLMVQAKTQHGFLNLRMIENLGPSFMPPDLASTHLDFPATLEQKEVYRLLDFDHIFRGDVDFEAKAIEEKLAALHESTTKAFRAAVTTEALDYWKGGGGT
jgi:uncharacterized protein (TIGR04255 family)